MFLSKYDLKKYVRCTNRKERTAREYGSLMHNVVMPYPDYSDEQLFAHVRWILKQRHEPVAETRSRIRAGVLPLDAARALERVKSEHHQTAGVYFLWNGPQLLYIGSSLYVGSRCHAHRRDGRLFTHATFMPVHQKIIRRLEEFHIRTHRPALNKVWCA